MFVFLSRHPHGPLIQAALGVVAVVAGFFAFGRILFALGGLLILWGIAGAITRRRRRGHDSSAESATRR